MAALALTAVRLAPPALAPALLVPLFGTDSQWKPLMMIYPVFMIICGVWIYLDASDRVGNGLFWGALAFCVPPLGVPLYFILVWSYSLYNSRQRRGPEQAGREQLEREGRKVAKLGELDRIKYLEQAEQSGGTIYNPLTGMGTKGQGYRHFRDERAEELILARRYSEAFDYLKDMHSLARQQNDVRAVDTYRHYIASLPGGRDLVKEL